jgi:predicted transcriptional regulator
VYEAIRARPVRTVAELTRDTALNEIVVRHHVRMLEQHRLVARRPMGRFRAYVAVDGSAGPLPPEALRDETRRAIAQLLAESPLPLTQKSIAQRCGVSTRLVSYHLARLERDGLAAGNGTTPRLYRAAGALAPAGPPGSANSAA